MAENDYAPKFAPFFGMAGICFAMTFGCIGAAYGTAKSGIGIAGVGTFRPDLIMKSLIPVVMSGIIAVYSLVIAVLIASDIGPPPNQHYSLFKYGNITRRVRPDANYCNSGFMHLACGLSVGLTGLAAGYAIGIVGDMGVRSYMLQSRIFVGMVLILIFGEVLGLYGLIVALILNTKSRG
ncbi:V-type proton ATPase 16 kDa proteolipid subunit [Lachnellula occidentalis]|uniref:V-type proton ATPase proteolipid subunit n=1 Tax=Lachnellula occidentalis TaxID=215460 RepID=A0A8H8RZ58_9HELO|nr:V-type proton ATPase 16 kDa proteolipid subunit [Lachnellula occidentalis]